MYKNTVLINGLFCMLLLFFMVNCKPGQGVDPPDPPVTTNPELESLSPGSMVTHLNGFTLTANGSNFRDGAVIVFNGTEKTTAFISASQLSCQIEPGELEATSSLVGITHSKAVTNQVTERTVPVYVLNPAPGSGESNRLDFSILDSFRFNDPVNISNSSRRAVLPRIFTDDNDYIHVAWRENLNSFWVIHYTLSMDYGATWSTPLALSDTALHSFNPDMCIGASGHVYMVWDSIFNGVSQVFFSRSTDNGVNWSPPVKITDTEYPAYQPKVAVDENGGLLLVWTEHKRRRNYEIYFSRSADEGASWSPRANIFPHSSQSVKQVMAAGADNTIFVAWKNVLPERGNIYSSRSLDGGGSWEPPLNHSNTEDECREPDIAIGKNGRLGIAWHQSIIGGGFDVMFTHSPAGGLDWSPAKEISGPSFYSSFTAITIDDYGNIDAVWVGEGNDVYFIRSIDHGETWFEEHSIFESQRNGSSLYPEIAAGSDGFVYIVWEDDISGTAQVFFSSAKR
jgi:hypothetical protein